MTEVRESSSPSDALPPVEPPSAGFIVQLFVVPAVIVTIIVMVWLLFSWLAQGNDDPKDYIYALERDNAARWQVAGRLADSLRSVGGRLNRDHEFASRLAQILEKELESGRDSDEDLKLKIFLCKALGEFKVPDGLPALLSAAQTTEGPSANHVRLAAIEGLALLADNLKGTSPLDETKAVDVLVEQSKESDQDLRGAAAFALGVVGGDQARERLAAMLTDSYPDVRYNAATGLARHGDPRSMEVLVEMLDPAGTAGKTTDPENASNKQALILFNGLQASLQMAEHLDVDVAPLREAIEKLKKVEIPEAKIRMTVLQVDRALERSDETAK